MRERVGTCSICGGDVIGYRGAWQSVLPAPPDECRACGAVAAAQSDAIPMTPRLPRPQTRSDTTTNSGKGWTTVTTVD